MKVRGYDFVKGFAKALSVRSFCLALARERKEDGSKAAFIGRMNQLAHITQKDV